MGIWVSYVSGSWLCDYCNWWWVCWISGLSFWWCGVYDFVELLIWYRMFGGSGGENGDFCWLYCGECVGWWVFDFTGDYLLSCG